MLPHIVTVVSVPLVQPHHRQDLRPEHTQNIRVRPQHLRRSPAGQELCQFHPDPLRSDLCQQCSAAVNALRRAGLNGKFQVRRKPQPPHHTQGILPEPPFRLSDAPQDPRLQIHRPAEGILEGPPQIHGHGIDRKIPPAQIFLQ